MKSVPEKETQVNSVARILKTLLDGLAKSEDPKIVSAAKDFRRAVVQELERQKQKPSRN